MTHNNQLLYGQGGGRIEDCSWEVAGGGQRTADGRWRMVDGGLQTAMMDGERWWRSSQGWHCLHPTRRHCHLQSHHHCQLLWRDDGNEYDEMGGINTIVSINADMKAGATSHQDHDGEMAMVQWCNYMTMQHINQTVTAVAVLVTSATAQF